MEQMVVKQDRRKEIQGGIRWGVLIISVLVPLVVGVLSALLSSKGMMLYETMKKPPLSPPGWVFSVAWSVLYILMGIAFYTAMEGAKRDGISSELKWIGILLYVLQLIMNFMWSIFFFRWELRLLAFVWLLMLLILVVLCTRTFMQMSKAAGWMMIPYVFWLGFAGYLNMGSYLLNR